MSELLNLVGLSTGVVLYAMLLAMVLRAGRAPGAARVRSAAARDRPARPGLEPLRAAGVRAAEGRHRRAVSVPDRGRLLSALGFLPAVVVHSVLRGERERASVRGWPKRIVACAAYAVSAVAAALHVARGVDRRRRAVAARHAAAHLRVRRAGRAAGRGHARQPGARRALWAAALSIFAVSALHLSQLHQGDASWPVELLGHHASLPLAFAILYQDFPFALADLFLKRALTLVALVGAALLGVAAIGAIHSPRAAAARSARRRPAGHVVGRDRAALPDDSPASSAGSSTPSCSIAPTTRRCAPTSAAGVQRHAGHRRAAGRRLRAAGARAERADGPLARTAGAAPARRSSAARRRHRDRDRRRAGRRAAALRAGGRAG